MYRDYWLLGLSRPASRVCSPSPEQMTLCCRVAKSTIRAGEKMKAGGETRRICLFDFKKTCSRCQSEALENNTRRVWPYGLV